MARIDERHPDGAPGDWYVDRRCIDCGAARHVAPDLIIRNPADGVSLFTRQPETDEEIAMAWRAVFVCPTRSVAHVELRRPPSPAFPQDLGDGVYRLGYNSRSSFGAHSYLVKRSNGNLLIDAPRWTRELAEPIATLGGIDYVLLTHRDDIADAERYAERFEAEVLIHSADRRAANFATALIEGTEPSVIAEDVVAFPVPGHTAGSVLYLVEGRLLFSGDSLSWKRSTGELHAFSEACWYSWAEQTRSLERFANSSYRFERLFCGHGWNQDLDADGFNRALHELVERM